MKRWTIFLCSMIASCLARAATPPALQIYFIDVEGGQSTLIVTPGRETVLMDAGYAGEGTMDAQAGDPGRARDPGRIVAAMRDAGVERIDTLIVSHFHRDHIGGIAELAQRVKIGRFVDYGTAYPPEERAKPRGDVLDFAAYDAYLGVRARAPHVIPHPGDRLAVKGIDLRFMSADRAVLPAPLPGAGKANAACRPEPLASNDPLGENPRSVGFLLTYGKFRFLDLGDLSDRPLFDLICPASRIGPVDLYLVAHHGGADVADPATLAAFEPRVAVVNNGPRKGGQQATLKMLREAGGVDSWQLHTNPLAGDDNAPADRIANRDETTAHWLKVTARPDGSFTVRNGRTANGKDYGVR